MTQRWFTPHLIALIILLTLGVTVAEKIETAPAPTTRPATQPAPISRWRTFISAEDLQARMPDQDLLIIDVRPPTDYGMGHIPQAINIPAHLWRDAAPPQGFFRQNDGSIDVARYEKLFSTWGIRNGHRIVVYDNSGKPEGVTAVGILKMLGHEHVAYLDGMGADEWTRAGQTLTVAASPQLPKSEYVAMQNPRNLWGLQDVRTHLQDPNTIFIDLRTPPEFTGELQRGSKHSGHIPRAKNLNQEELFDRVKRTVLPPYKVLARVNRLALPKNKETTLVVYCHSSTKAIFGALLLRELGYENVAVYDEGWREYGNRDDTKIEKTEKTAETTR